MNYLIIPLVIIVGAWVWGATRTSSKNAPISQDAEK